VPGHHWFSRSRLVGLAILAVVVVFDLIAISTDFHDADGFLDCWPQCSTWQHAIRWSLSVGVLLLLVLVIAAVLRVVLRGRSR
jgi:hypothetical protein